MNLDGVPIILPWLILSAAGIALALHDVWGARDDLGHVRRIAVEPAVLLIAADLVQQATRRLGTFAIFVAIGVGALSLPPPWSDYVLRAGLYVVTAWMILSIWWSRQTRRRILHDEEP